MSKQKSVLEAVAEAQKRIAELESGHQKEKDQVVMECKKKEAELQLKVKNKQRQIDTL